MSAKVSIILPSLNVADYIEECMESAVGQTLHELEIICVDAGSTDGTREILERYARKDSRITVINSAEKSYGRQVNIGLDYASGEYVAVLETDDWIEQDMYRHLYELATADGLDYAAADYDSFYQLQSGCYYFVRHHIFSMGNQEWYGKILNSDQIATLRSSDYVLWRGIYNRKFLNINNIRLHESTGAAFQDMGFLQQVKTYAGKATYINKSFYRYRQDRNEASSKCLEGFRYYEGEFRWLNARQKFMDDLNDIHKKYYYFTISISFITKYEQILSVLNGEWQDERLMGPYIWFQKQLSDAISSGLLDQTLYGKEQWERMMLLLVSQEAHACQVINMNKEKDRHVQEFVSLIKNRLVVIFGCGRRGERLMFFCDRNHICMDSFCDNNVELQGGKKFGFPVISPEDLKKEVYNKNEVIILSVKEGIEDIYNQLVGFGIETDRIIRKIPEGIL